MYRRALCFRTNRGKAKITSNNTQRRLAIHMKWNGFIFDFNGTLFWDTPYHNESWDIILGRYGLTLTAEELFRNIHGRTNEDIYAYLFPESPSLEQANAFAEEKEAIYRDICLKHGMHLAPGAERLLNELKEHGIPRNIATASGKTNVDFFIEQFRLERWFDLRAISYDDGTVPGKPAPDILLRGIERIGMKPEEVVIFEDSHAGIRAAKASGAKQVIIVNSNHDSYSGWHFPVIRSYDDVKREFFL